VAPLGGQSLINLFFTVGAGDSYVARSSKGGVAVGLAKDDEFEGKAAATGVVGTGQELPGTFERYDRADDRDPPDALRLLGSPERRPRLCGMRGAMTATPSTMAPQFTPTTQTGADG